MNSTFAISTPLKKDVHLIPSSHFSVGHSGKFGHEFLEFEFQPDGKLRYANNSNYKRDSMIRKEATVSRSVMEELRRVILDSEIMKEDDKLWPQANRDGRQELEIIYGGEHICFSVLTVLYAIVCLIISFCRLQRSGRL